MKLRYYLTRTDMVRSTIRAALFNRPFMTYVAAFSVVMVGLSLKTEAANGRTLAFLVFLAVFQFACIAILIVIGLAVTTGLALFFGKGRGIVGEHELEISDAGLIERTEFNDSLHRWQGVTAVRESGGYYFIRVFESGGSLHVIPKCRPLLAGELPAFIGEVRKRIAAKS